jgi:hypothetical protein
MMAQLTFDTLAFVKRLAAAGMDTRQAEAFAEALSKHAFTEVATKSDLKELELRLTLRMGAMSVAIIAILGAMISVS